MLNPIEILSTHTFGNPDYGRSDIWHFNLPLKFFFSQALKDGYFPFWAKDVGTGFPLLAEGQVGMFSIYNLIAFKFLDPILAFNLGFLVTILTAASGMYLFGKLIKLSKLTSLFAATIFSLSGIFFTHIVHYNLIQAISFLPWEFFLIEKFLQSNKKGWLWVYSICLGLQLFAGFPQVFLISMIGIAIYFVCRLVSQNNQQGFLKSTITVLAFSILGVVIASPQLLPTWELVKVSGKSDGLVVSILAQFPFHPKNLLNFINPYIFGDPRTGSYPPFSSNWGVFWETTGYFGLVPFLLSFLSLFYLKKSLLKKTFLLMAFISLVLLLGKYTPFFFLFQLPPLSFFRLPARFIILFVFALTVLSALVLEKVAKRSQLLALIITLVSIIDIGFFAVTYNPIINAKNLLQEPESVKVLRVDKSWFRIYSVIPGEEWNKIYLSYGWKNMDKYINFRNALDPNQNMYWNVPSVTSYNAIKTRRQEIYEGLIAGEFVKKDGQIKFSSTSARLLSLAGVKYIISPKKIETERLNEIFSTSGEPKFYIYQNPTAMPHAYLTTDYEIASSLTDLVQKTITTTGDIAVIEKEINLQSKGKVTGLVNVITDDNRQVVIQTTNNETDSLLILSDSYYPAWKAYIDGKETEILATNINQRSVILPKGNHTTVFKYFPWSFKIF